MEISSHQTSSTVLRHPHRLHSNTEPAITKVTVMIVLYIQPAQGSNYTASVIPRKLRGPTIGEIVHYRMQACVLSGNCLNQLISPSKIDISIWEKLHKFNTPSKEV